MQNTMNDPDPDKKITNSDEQDVAVNHSTKEEGGYDEPASTSAADTGRIAESEKKDPEKKKESFKSNKIN